jgi:hypothetical protein
MGGKDGEGDLMPIRYVETEYDRTMLIRYVEQHPLPLSVDIQKERHRTTRQNRLQRQWMNDIAGQTQGHDAEYWRGYCKLHFGVPIMRAVSEAFQAIYDEVIRPLPYEHKLKIMCVPIDLAVTRDMNSKQMTAYLDAVQQHFAEQGIVLTDPEAMRWGAAA